MASRFSRSRATAFARRLAIGALDRLVVQVDRWATALETSPTRLSLRSNGAPATNAGWRAPVPEPEPEPILEVRPKKPPASSAPVSSPPAEPPPTDAPSVEPPPTETPPAEPPPARPSVATPPPAKPTPSPQPPSAPASTPVVNMEAAVAQVAHLRRRVEPQITALRSHTDWENAEEPLEALRQLRVATRRLRSFVAVFGPTLGDKRARKLRKRLRTITRGIGPLRERDVLLYALRAAHTDADPLLRAALEHVIAQVDLERPPLLEQAREAVAQVDLERVANTLDHQLDRICGRMLRLDDRLSAQCWTLLAPQIARVFDRLPQPREHHEVEALHDVRTRAKRLRYALEMFRPLLGDAYRPLRKPAKRIQRALGEHHDDSLLAQLLTERQRQLQAQGLQTLAGGLQPMLDRLHANQQRAHARARPALELLVAQRYESLTREALGLGPMDAPPPPPEPTPADDDGSGVVETT